MRFDYRNPPVALRLRTDPLDPFTRDLGSMTRDPGPEDLGSGPTQFKAGPFSCMPNAMTGTGIHSKLLKFLPLRFGYPRSCTLSWLLMDIQLPEPLAPPK